MKVYDFSAKTIDGCEISLGGYQGNVLLIVNTASKCGFTHQYEELETLHQKYSKDGLVILGFPCNQFKNQEPESNEKIRDFCTATYGITFPMFEKIDVKGEQAHPLYRYLTEQHKFEGFNFGHPLGQKLDEILSEEDQDYALSNDVKWNFTKFVIDREGNCVKRFEPTTDLSEVEEYIKTLL